MNRFIRERRQGPLYVVAILSVLACALTHTPEATAVDPSRSAKAKQVRPDVRHEGAVVRDRPEIVRERTAVRHPRHRWILGVRGDNLQVGLRITNVIPNTPAWYVGLERNDQIVCVAGYQIGYVEGHLYPLDEELRLRADPLGWIRLLVWDHRTGKLMNIDVQLQDGRLPRVNEEGIRGLVTFRKALVPKGVNAHLRILLFDTSKPMGELRPVAVLEKPYAGKVPIEFHLEENVAELDEHGRYGLKAYLEVLDNGRRRILSSGTRAHLLKRVSFQRVDLELGRVRFDRQRPFR